MRIFVGLRNRADPSRTQCARLPPQGRSPLTATLCNIRLYVEKILRRSLKKLINLAKHEMDQSWEKTSS
jgi:hypothetical protein